jgi:hypothetical protein
MLMDIVVISPPSNESTDPMTTSIADPRTLDIAPLSGTIGAEVRNVDLHQPLDPPTVAAIRQALLDYK